MVDIICLGEAMVEFNQSTDGTWVQGFGGDTSNCAISAARQGVQVGYLTKVGEDYFGEKLFELWRSEGVDVSAVMVDSQSPTGIYFVTHDAQGHHYNYYRKHSAASGIVPEELSEEYIARAKILHVSAISQGISESASASVVSAIKMAKAHNTLVAYDTNLRLSLWNEEQARSTIHEAMKDCDIALPSYDDAVILTGLNDPDAIVDFYLDLGASFVALKCGDRGALVATANERKTIPRVTVNSIDANGAGDTFAGALLAEIARGAKSMDAAEYANIAAALSTTLSGAVTAIPHRSKVIEFNRP